MAKLGKRMREALEKVESLKEYELMEAVTLAKETARTKFDESVDVAVRLGVDSRKADQNIRGSVLLPKGTGKKFRILVFAKGEKEAEAREAGAEFVGTVTGEQVRDIARTKMEDLNANNVEQAARIIEGSAKSMGIQVEG